MVFSRRPSGGHSDTRRILSRLSAEDAVVPEIWGFEIANGIFVACNKRKRITEPQVQEYLRLLKALPIRSASQPLWTNVDLEALARRHDLAAYDAAYLRLAQRSALSLVTSDSALLSTAMAVGVPVL